MIDEVVVLTEVAASWWDWDQDPNRGWRLFVVGQTYDRETMCVVMYEQ